MNPSAARRVWWHLETLHAVSYFAPECLEPLKQVGYKGFWSGYFAARSAPLGPVGPGLVEALFLGFHPARVRRALPSVWDMAPPDTALRVRREGAAAALRATAPEVDQVASEAAALLRPAVAQASPSGRPLFAANQELPLPEDPVEELWQHTTSLREHRGDGHVALLVGEGLDGCLAGRLFAAAEGIPSDRMRDSRGWSEQEWAAGAEELRQRGFLGADGAVTEDGRRLRTHVETRTDALAAPAYRGVDVDRVMTLLRPVAERVLHDGVVPPQNPIGLPIWA